MAAPRLAKIPLPDFGLPTVQPKVPAATYEARLRAVRARGADAGFDVLVVYADREHFANMAWLTGFEPRFEEALLVAATEGDPVLVVGNECLVYAEASPVDLRTVLYQGFSLLDQPRDASAPIADILRDAGIRDGVRVGVVGWKYFTPADGTGASERWIDAPSYLVDVLRALAGPEGNVGNATALFMNPRDGLRTVNDVDQLAAFEFAACHTSSSVRNVLFNLRPGMTEFDAVQLMGLNGLPLSCHLMLASGPRARMGLTSPEMRTIERGDPFTTAFGLWGALNCRAGFVVAGADELPPSILDYVDRLVAPYFRAVAEWYETVGIGVTGGALFEVVRRRLGDPFFGVHLNPGHLIGLDEWLSSPIFEGSDIPLGSGMVLQVDIIPATGTDYFTTNIEDGIALADEPLRAAFAERFPEAWGRIEARRRFMAEGLGIRLNPDVLPFSNIPAFLPPFLLRPDLAMTLAPSVPAEAAASNRSPVETTRNDHSFQSLSNGTNP